MASTVELYFDETPNPNAIKITLSCPVVPSGKTYKDAATADAPWAKALLGIDGIIGVFGVNNFISAQKTEPADWEVLIPQMDAALKRALQA